MERATGKAYWRSLGDYANTPEFRAWAEQEFPQLAAELDRGEWADNGPSRRRFLQIMGASIALAGLATAPGCRRPEQKLLPVNKKSPEQIPGKPLFYASTFVQAGVPMGILVETHEGRPTKIEGNPKHPTSLGATSTFAQASLLDLYDPSRSRTVLHNGQPADLKADFYPALDKLSKELLATKGKGLAILSEHYASPAFEMLKEHFAKVMPEAKFYVDEPSTFTGGYWSKLGYDLSNADVILSLDNDFLGLDDFGIKNKRAFAKGRSIDQNGGKMNRLYVVEPTFTVTGANADHHIRLPLCNIPIFADKLANALRGEPTKDKEIASLAADLLAHKGRVAIIVGARNPSISDAAVEIFDLVGAPFNMSVAEDDLYQLSKRIYQGEIQTLLVLGGNPAFTAPRFTGNIPNGKSAIPKQFVDMIAAVPTTIRLSVNEDETSAYCNWHIPKAHYLESWGDAVTYDGLYSPIQPMIEPLFGGITSLELLARLGAYQTTDGYKIVRQSFANFVSLNGLDEKWRQCLHEGIASGSKKLRWPSGSRWGDADVTPFTLNESHLELCFALSPSTFDGRYANNGWMQEMPDPITKLSWDNAALFSPKTARELDLKHGDVVTISVNGRSVEAPVFIQPGTADYSITLPLGYGRTKVGPVGEGAGFNAYQLRTSNTLGFAVGAKVTKTGKTYKLATSQEHWTVAEHHLLDEQLGERAIVREGTLEEFHEHPEFAQHQGAHVPHHDDIATNPLDGYKAESARPGSTLQQWGMVVDLNACVGCNACAVACQAENNVPIVGKDAVMQGREMHWLRIDRYFKGENPEGDVEAVAQPMMCQHCENAPCEPVCPVNATTHTEEGLNAMTYNRCIGTRYCANNCPYKVRRFNFFDYNKGTLYGDPLAQRAGGIAPDPTRGLSKPQSFQPDLQELLKMVKNPQVTVRMRGVMEKCTFCVQRIENARINHHAAAGLENPGKIPDGTFQSACQQACPTQAIVFGDISQPGSRVSLARQSPRNYEVLGHLNTKPRTTYLARVRNPNPNWPGEKAEKPAGGKHARFSLPILGEVRG